MTQNRLSRRAFLTAGGLTLGAAGLTVCRLTALSPEPHPIERPSYKFGGKDMNNRVLVTYATCNGSTVDVAATIAETLNTNGTAVDVIPIEDEPQVEDYQAVLIGSAVQYASWLPQAVDFVKANQEALNRLPVALFCVHIQNLGDDATSRQNRAAYLDKVRPFVQPVAEGYFAGKFDWRGAALLLPGLVARFIPPIDLRKWDKMRAWAKHIKPLLAQ
jgi:menaquinone-dependent protoporphyrinogen oxidase